MPEKPPLRRRPMAAGSWVRSLQCKSMAVEDVAARGSVVAVPRKLHPLLPRSGCASTGDARKGVAPSKPKPTSTSSSDPSKMKKSGSKPSPNKPVVVKKTPKRPGSVVPPSPPPGPLGPIPALTELPAGHSSRQVVEIIFLSSWSPLPSPPPQGAGPTSAGSAFPGEVEMLFRVHNPARAVARFEDYRAAVRARAGGASRSAADGNEMMRFSPAPPPYGSAASAAYGGAEDALVRVRTFDGSGGAHASAARGVAATGRRAMFLCRVIAGRVKEAGLGSGEETPGKEHDSVRVGKGELVVFDRRAVLPCFLVIYKL
ncbi:hypothetical protein QOZ80_2BG0195590 [Eleusine coracana subsp. coracana]|nr:hypothetical protein QOZ80_2BG0195590 [Eleusine coracana subsp. coracana]